MRVTVNIKWKILNVGNRHGTANDMLIAGDTEPSMPAQCHWSGFAKWGMMILSKEGLETLQFSPPACFAEQ